METSRRVDGCGSFQWAIPRSLWGFPLVLTHDSPAEHVVSCARLCTRGRCRRALVNFAIYPKTDPLLVFPSALTRIDQSQRLVFRHWIRCSVAGHANMTVSYSLWLTHGLRHQRVPVHHARSQPRWTIVSSPSQTSAAQKLAILPFPPS